MLSLEARRGLFPLKPVWGLLGDFDGRVFVAGRLKQIPNWIRIARVAGNTAPAVELAFLIHGTSRDGGCVGRGL